MTKSPLQLLSYQLKVFRSWQLRKQFKIVTVAWCLAIGFSPTQLPAHTLYQLTDLGDLPGGFDASFPATVNNKIQVVGSSYVRNVAEGAHAFLWESGVMIDLGDLPGGLDYSGAQDVNEAGQVVGWSSGASYFNAFVWDEGEMSYLGDLPGGKEESYATAINNTGQAVGFGTFEGDNTPQYPRHAVIWDLATFAIQDLGDLPGGSDSSTANDINDRGQVVGYGTYGDGVLDQHAFLWDPNTGTMRDLGDLFGGTAYSTASAINYRGQVVGHSSYSNQGDSRAFLWDPKTKRMTGLKSLQKGLESSFAYDINNKGQIVGSALYRTPTSQNSVPVIWEKGKIAKLNDLILRGPDNRSILVTSASGINDNGQIAASGYSYSSPDPFFVVLGTLHPCAMLRKCVADT